MGAEDCVCVCVHGGQEQTEQNRTEQTPTAADRLATHWLAGWLVQQTAQAATVKKKGRERSWEPLKARPLPAESGQVVVEWRTVVRDQLPQPPPPPYHYASRSDSTSRRLSLSLTHFPSPVTPASKRQSERKRKGERKILSCRLHTFLSRFCCCTLLTASASAAVQLRYSPSNTTRTLEALTECWSTFAAAAVFFFFFLPRRVAFGWSVSFCQ